MSWAERLLIAALVVVIALIFGFAVHPLLFLILLALVVVVVI